MTFALLPDLVLALIVFAHFFIARMIKRTVRKLTRDRCQARNLGLVLGQWAQGIAMLVELFIPPIGILSLKPTISFNDWVLVALRSGLRFEIAAYLHPFEGEPPQA